MPEMRDTADAFLTAYNTEGRDAVGYPYGQLPQYPVDEIPMAETAYGSTFGHSQDDDAWEQGLGRTDPRRMAQFRRWLWLLPPVERRIVKRELRNDPKRMMSLLEPMIVRPNFRDLVSKSALKAVANEFDPKLYPETSGYWPVLRQAVKKTTTDTVEYIGQFIEKLSPDERLAALEKLMLGGAGVSGFGDDPATPTDTTGGFWGSLVTGITQAAAAIYGARLQSQTAKDIAKMQEESARRQAELQAKLAAAQAAMIPAAPGAAPGVPGAPGVPPAAEGGIPLPLVIGGVATAGLVAYLALRG